MFEVRPTREGCQVQVAKRRINRGESEYVCGSDPVDAIYFEYSGGERLFFRNTYCPSELGCVLTGGSMLNVYSYDVLARFSEYNWSFQDGGRWACGALGKTYMTVPEGGSLFLAGLVVREVSGVSKGGVMYHDLVVRTKE